MELFRIALGLLDADEPLALVTVTRASGSTPRHPGAKMLVCGDGRTFGTVGGGRIELEATEAGFAVARGAAAQRLERHLVRDLGMCCGGAMELYVEPVAPSRVALAAAIEAHAARRRVVLVTPLDGGAKRVEADDGSRAPRLDGGTLREPLAPSSRLVLFGGGHVARAIGPIAASVGFEVVVCDDGEVEQLEPVPGWVARAVDSFELADVERAVGGLGGGDFAVILTRDHALDQRILEQLLPRQELSYLGLIGSRGKVGRFRRRIVAKGLTDEAAWARLHAPIGFDIGAETPAEIAISVVAELVRARRREARDA